MKSALYAAAMLSTAYAAGGNYDYKKQGADWGSVDVANNKCGDDFNQSPIDLPSRVDRDKFYDTDDDNFQKLYTNVP